MTDIVLSESMWTAGAAHPRRSKARAEAYAAQLPAGGSLVLSAGGVTLRTITVGAWSVGAVQSDGRYPLIPGTFTDPETGSGTPDTAIFKDAGGVEKMRMSAGVGSGTFRLANPLVADTPITRGAFVVLYASDDIPIPPVDPPPPVTGNKVVAAGSSSIDLWSSIAVDLLPAQVTETGVSGATTTTLLASVQPLITNYGPDGVLLYIGENDISGAVAPATVAANIEAICEAIWLHLPAARIFIMSIKPSPLRWSWWDEMQACNGLLETYCGTDDRLIYIDVSSALLSGGNPVSAYYLSDDLHLSSAGYAVWTSIIQPVLAAVLHHAPSQSYVDVMIDDMRLTHDGPSRTLQWIPQWGSGWGMPASYPKPAGWTTVGAWGVIMEDYSGAGTPPQGWLVPGPYTGNQAPNTRAQVRDIQFWWLLSNGTWVLGRHNHAPGGYMYLSSWAGETYTAQNTIRDEPASNGGGRSCQYINMNGPGYPFEDWHWHFFGSRMDAPANYVGFASAFFARKILHNPDGADDRASARLLVDTAGDWWITPTAQWAGNGVNNRPTGYNRFKYLTNDWQLVAHYSRDTLTEAQVRANPPPFIGR